MAINLFNKYGSRANPPSIDYPEGSIKNRSAPDVKDGTPLDADWANDHQGFFQSILSYFGVTANGTPDKVGASQYFDALMSDPTEALRGMPMVATAAQAQALTDDARMLTPKKLADAFGGANQGLTDNGYQKLPSGLIIQWGVNIIPSGAVGSPVTLPIAFNNAFLGVTLGVSLTVVTPFYAPGYSNKTLTGFSITNPNTSGVAVIDWLAVGH